MHARGVGVILDWVPAHFPRDQFALARFDGTALYEHADPRRGAHPDWGTLVFNFGRHEVRNFLISNALFWLREYHVDGIRVDAVASMLYLDYSRRAGEWVPNQFGGREDLEAVEFLKELNEVIYAAEPGIISAAEESTAWPGVSRPTYLGGLGFGFKWNMGWMHDTLAYFQQDPIYRRYHHHELTFSLMYAFSENFVLPLSHDEVVHGKGSLYTKMAGADPWQKLANLRALYAYMWAHPGKKLLFMGQRVRPAVRVEPRALAGLAPARAARARRHPVAGPRPQPPLPRRARPVRARLRSGRVLVAGAQRRRQQRHRLRPPLGGLEPRGRVRGQPVAGAALRLPPRPAPVDPLAGGAQHRLLLLRRQRRRQPGRGRSPSRSRGTTRRSRPRSRCPRWRPCGSCLMSSGALERAAEDAYPWERPLGARLIGDGLAEFRVWAPRAETIALRLGGRDHPLRDAGYGVYETIADCRPPATDYRFVVDGSELPDPVLALAARGAARAVADARRARAAGARATASSRRRRTTS